MCVGNSTYVKLWVCVYVGVECGSVLTVRVFCMILNFVIVYNIHHIWECGCSYKMCVSMCVGVRVCGDVCMYVYIIIYNVILNKHS